ncbi:MAG: TonB-dependent receptor [Cyclobacteriaceae bacterium]|nr:MAG: TonB-dependent receptor [Cyclobacteriaceae bacterium]
MKKFLLIIVAVFSMIAGFSQGNGRIIGVVIDEKSKLPVEFATVALTDAEGKTVNGTIADAKGKFEIEKIANGTYTVTISFIGYETITKSDLVLDGRKPEINLGTVSIAEEATQLGEVVVEAKKDLVEERVDRTIYNAENDATTRGGDASDVLKRVPMLSVDLDGNVSMRGSSNIMVLINNKPSTIMANSVADALKQIPADQIKTVEVITSPSAKYDAEGSAGIINIITKKNTLEGLTLNVDAGAGLRGSNLGLNGNYRRGKMGFSLGGFGRANYNVSGAFENDQLNTVGTTETRSLQSAENRNQGIFGNYNLGWDYDINKKNSLAASVRYGMRNNNSYQDNLISEIYTNDVLTSNSLRDVNTKDLSGNVDMNLSYNRYFEKPQQEFTLLAMYSRNDRNNNFTNTIYNTSTEEIFQRLKNLNDGLNEEFTIQADYQTPIKDNQMFEIGVKEIKRKVLSDFQYFTADGANGEFIKDSDQTRSNQLNYNQDVLSGYLSYTYSAKSGYSFKAGTRYEYTIINAFTRTEADIDIPEYGVIVPSFNASKKLKKGTVKASYNRRIQRPSIQFLNPNIQNPNPLSESVGNPSLDPEFTNNFEVGYSTFIKGTSLNLTGFVRNSNNAIQSFRQIVRDSVIRTTYGNLGQENAYGASVFTNISAGKLSFNVGGDVYFADMVNPGSDLTPRVSNSGWVYSGRGFGSYDLGKGWALQGFGFYRGRRVNLQGFQGGFGTYSIGARKEFKNKKGSIGAGLENFLAPSMKIRNSVVTKTETQSINQNSFTEMRNFSFRINLSYRIGKMSFDQQRRRGRSVNNDDLKMGGDGDGGGMDNGGGNMNGGQSGGRGNMGGGQRNTTIVVQPANEVKADTAAVVVAEGNWEYSVESPQGANGGTLKITKEGDAYSGVIINARINRETPLKDVTVNGNELSFTYEVSFGGNTSNILVKGIITGDQFAGNMTMGQFGSFPMTAKRAAQ